MAPTAKQVIPGAACPKCKAEVRVGAQFCYNCGGPLQGVADAEPGIKTGPNADGNAPAALPVENPERRPAAESLRTAAALRRRARPRSAELVEVAWVPPRRMPAMYLIVAIGVTLFTIVALVAAMYLR